MITSRFPEKLHTMYPMCLFGNFSVGFCIFVKCCRSQRGFFQIFQNDCSEGPAAWVMDRCYSIVWSHYCLLIQPLGKISTPTSHSHYFRLAQDRILLLYCARVCEKRYLKAYRFTIKKSFKDSFNFQNVTLGYAS